MFNLLGIARLFSQVEVPFYVLYSYHFLYLYSYHFIFLTLGGGGWHVPIFNHFPFTSPYPFSPYSERNLNQLPIALYVMDKHSTSELYTHHSFYF